MNEELKIIITAAVTDAIRDIENTQKEIKELEEKTEAASKAADESFAKIGEVTKTAMTAVAGAVAAGAAALVGLAESTREYRNEQAKLNTAFEVAGYSAEAASNVYNEFVGILGESGDAVEASNHLAKLGATEEELAEITEVCTGIWATFGKSIDLPGFTEAINHTSKLGEVQGTLADSLEWCGITVDDFNEELAKCGTEQKRQQLITQTLSKHYKGAATQFKATNKEVIESNKATEKWNKSLAKLVGKVEPVVTDFKELGATLVEELEEPLEDVTKYITKEFIPALTKTIKWVGENKDTIIVAGAAIATAVTGVQLAMWQAKLAQEGLTIATVAHTAAQKALNAVMSLNPWSLALGALAALTAGIVAYNLTHDDTLEGVSKLTEEQENLKESINEATEAIKSQKEAYEISAGNIKAESDYTKKLADELLSLADAKGKVKESDETRAQFIINELNEALGTEYSMVDGVIQKYKSLEKSVYDVINAKAANALLEAKNEAYITAIQKEDIALQTLTEAQRNYEDARGSSQEKIKTWEAEIEELREKRVQGVGILTDAEMLALSSSIDELGEKVDKEKAYLGDLEDAYNDALLNYSTYYNTIEEYRAASMLIEQGNYQEAIDMLKNKSDSYFEYADDVSEATKQTVDALYKEAVVAGIRAQETKENFENGVKDFTKEMVEEAEEGYEKALKAWGNAYNDANGIGGDLSEGLKDGMASKESSLLSRARSLIKNIWNTMKDEADSHSPSRKTMALGGDMGEGLEIGLDESAADVAKAGKNLIEEALTPMEVSLNGVAANNLGGVFSTSTLGAAYSSISSKVKDNYSVKAETTNGSPVTLQLVVDKKVFGEVSVNSINDLTAMRGSIPLNIM